MGQVLTQQRRFELIPGIEIDADQLAVAALYRTVTNLPSIERKTALLHAFFWPIRERVTTASHFRVHAPWHVRLYAAAVKLAFMDTRQRGDENKISPVYFEHLRRLEKVLLELEAERAKVHNDEAGSLLKFLQENPQKELQRFQNIHGEISPLIGKMQRFRNML